MIDTCLSIREPQALEVIAGSKPIENRVLETRFRGRFLVHACRCRQPAIIGSVELFDVVNYSHYDTKSARPVSLERAILKQLGERGRQWLDSLTLTLKEAHAHAVGPYCWLLRSPLAYPSPIPIKGRLTLWHPPSDVLTAADEQEQLHAGPAVESE